MNATAWAVTAAGTGLLGLVALDIYRIILHSRGRSGPVTETLTRTDVAAGTRRGFSPLAPGPPRVAQPRGPAALTRDCRDAGGADYPWVCAALLVAPARKFQLAQDRIPSSRCKRRSAMLTIR
jgi:hypothetical protein